MVFDRDSLFAAGVQTTLRSMQMKPTRTGHRSPWQSGVAERFVACACRKPHPHEIS
jgi:hypothetical protein